MKSFTAEDPPNDLHSLVVAKIQSPLCNINLISLLYSSTGLFSLHWSFLIASWQTLSFLTPSHFSSHLLPWHFPLSPRAFAQAVPSAWNTFHIIGAFLAFAPQPQKALFFVLCLNNPLSCCYSVSASCLFLITISFSAFICQPLFLFNLETLIRG